MTEQPKRKSSLARSTQLPDGGRSLDDFVARANEQLAEVATAFTLEDRESREEVLQREVEAKAAEVQAKAAEVLALQDQLASRRRRARIGVVAAFVLGAGAMFAIDVARSASHETAAPSSTPQVAVEPPPPPPPATPTPPPPPSVVTPSPQVAVEPPPVVTPAPTPPPVAVRPVKKKPPAKPPSTTPDPPTKPPPDDEGLVNPF